jgi:flagellin-like hook-associated protein FlgL
MASNITLSAGVRQNLLSLQNTASLSALTQNRLATGKKVNSALDNPLNYFTSASLQDRAGDLNTLLDSIGQATQTLKAADQGITSLTTLVQSAKSIATQALQTTKGTVNYTNVTGTVALAADTTQVTSTSSLATAGTASVQSTFTMGLAGLGELNATDTVALTLNGTTKTFTFVAANASAANGTFTTLNDLRDAINHANGFGGATPAASAAVAANVLTVTSTDVTSDFSHVITDTDSSGAPTAGNFVDTAHSVGDALTVSDGTNTHTYYRVAGSVTSTANGVYSDGTSLKAALDASNLVSGGPLVVTNNSDIVTFARSDAGTLTFGGTTAVSAGLATASTGKSYTGNYNSSLTSLTGDITVQIGSGDVHTITFGSGTGQINTRAALNTLLASYTDTVGSVDGTGHFNIAPTSTDDVTIGGKAQNLTALGIAAGTLTPTGTVVTANSTRSALQNDFNNLLTQIDQLASDSSYNGINLLSGDQLKVVFNGEGTSSLSIQGVKFNATGLNLTAISGTGFQDNKIINDTLAKIGTALTTLRTQAGKFGSNLTTVQTRQDFTKNVINNLQTGADALVLADTNEEGANLLALQTRQQLSTTALSMANQASQAVLRLFG